MNPSFQEFATYLRKEKGMAHFKLFTKYKQEFYEDTMNHLAFVHPHEEHIRNLEALAEGFQQKVDPNTIQLPFPDHKPSVVNDKEKVVKQQLRFTPPVKMFRYYRDNTTQDDHADFVG